MPEDTEYLPSSQAAKRGFTGFCLGEFRDDCIEGSDACLDWERCYKTLSHLDDDRQPIDLRKAARESWPDDAEDRIDIVAGILVGKGDI